MLLLSLVTASQTTAILVLQARLRVGLCGAWLLRARWRVGQSGACCCSGSDCELDGAAMVAVERSSAAVALRRLWKRGGETGVLSTGELGEIGTVRHVALRAEAPSIASGKAFPCCQGSVEAGKWSQVDNL